MSLARLQAWLSTGCSTRCLQHSLLEGSLEAIALILSETAPRACRVSELLVSSWRSDWDTGRCLDGR